MYKSVFCIFCCLLLTSCVSYYSKRDLNRSLNFIQSAVKRNMPEGVKWVSKNHREIQSQYFRPGDYKPEYKSSKYRVYRAYARAWILGDRRPYHLILKVYIEIRLRASKDSKAFYSQRDLTAGKWMSMGRSGEIAKRLGQMIYDYIEKANENWDVIDNFRAF